MRKTVSILMILLGIVIFQACNKPSALTNPDGAIQGTWLASPVESGEKVRWIFNSGELRIEYEIGGVTNLITWSKDGDTLDYLNYTITADASTYLSIDRIGWNPSMGVPNKWDIPIKGNASEFVITELDSKILYISSQANTGAGVVGGEAQRGFTKQ